MVVVVVGDTDRETVADLAARYIGTLPSGEPGTFVNRRPDFPSGEQRITVGVEPASGAEGFDMAFGAEAPITTRQAVVADVATAVINDLLFARVREELGDAYSVGASISPDDVVGTWEARISSTGATDGLDAGHTAIIEILTELMADGPAKRDLDQAIAVVSADYGLETNVHIMGPLLRRSFLDDAEVATREQRREALETVTAADVQRFVTVLFNLGNRIEVFRTTS